MQMITSLLCLSLLIVILCQAVTFHKTIVCRQKIWLRGTESITTTLLSEPKSFETIWIRECNLAVQRRLQQANWKKNKLTLNLAGHL
jgi:hypothetical protein